MVRILVKEIFSWWAFEWLTAGGHQLPRGCWCTPGPSKRVACTICQVHCSYWPSRGTNPRSSCPPLFLHKTEHYMYTLNEQFAAYTSETLAASPTTTSWNTIIRVYSTNIINHRESWKCLFDTTVMLIERCSLNLCRALLWKLRTASALSSFIFTKLAEFPLPINWLNVMAYS
jgi:hypothetical protein